jgi:hypothetical protein
MGHVRSKLLGKMISVTMSEHWRGYKSFTRLGYQRFAHAI